MLVNHNIIDNLCEDAGEQRKQKAQKYRDENRIYFKKVEYENPMNFEVTAEVEGTDTYNTYIQVKNGEIENITCTCPDYYNYYGVCKHTLATVLTLADYNVEKIEKHENKATVQKEKKYTNFSQIVKTIYNHELTDMTDVLADKMKESILSNIPLKRFGQPEEIAETAVFLAKSKYITGQVIRVDGGMVIG